MSISIRKGTRDIFSSTKWLFRKDWRVMSTLPDSKLEETEKPPGRRLKKTNPILECRHAYPEFLPDPNPKFRNSLREKLERLDMLSRRTHIDIPEFYVGSILAVTISDPHAQGKTNKFVGICIERKGCGLRAEFTLRNVVDHQGIEVRYEQYDPAIQKIQVLRLEKRLDDNLTYLRDCLPEFSTFPVDMDPETLLEDEPVPVNPIKVTIKPKPWREKWEKFGYEGIANIDEELTEKRKWKRDKYSTPWEKYDLVKQYRKTIPEEDQAEIWSEVYNQLHQLQLARKKTSRKRTFSLPKPVELH